MGIIWLLIKASWIRVVVAILAGLASGGCSARLIALINTAIASNPQNLVWPFAGLAVIALITGSLTQFLLTEILHHSQ
jgi:putative ATP-binding cassette transporter